MGYRSSIPGVVGKHGNSRERLKRRDVREPGSNSTHDMRSILWSDIFFQTRTAFHQGST